MYGTGATWIGPCDCLSGAHSCVSLLMPPKHKERKKVARTVPAKAKREGSQQDSSLMVVRSDRGKPKKKYQKPICYWGGCTTISQRWGLCRKHGGTYPCLQEGCGQYAYSGGYCVSHGGGKKCKMEGCTTAAESRVAQPAPKILDP